ncbi:MAG: hypothetical protein ACJ735_16965 [Actinomycetes bacterium]
MPDPVSTPQDVPDVAAVPAQRDAATSHGKPHKGRDRGGFLRRFTVGLLVAVFALLVPVTFLTTWVHRTVLNTDAYVNTVAPIAKDKAVTAAVSRQVTDQLFTALNPQAVVADALPPKAAFLAGPIANGAHGYVQNAVDRVLQSQQFQTLWVEANRTSHAQLVAVLRGHTSAVRTTNGQVVLDLVPLLNQALQNIQGFASSVVGRPITLPTITTDDIPAEACQKIADALNRPVPPTCAQIPLFPSDQLTQAQRLVRAFDAGVIVLLVLTPLVAVGALLLSRRRRRTLFQLSIAATLGVVIVRRAAFYLQDHLVATGKPENKDARRAILHHGLNSFFTSSMWILIGLLVVVAVALVTGPYGFAVKIRRWLGAAWRGAVNLVRTAVSVTSTAAQSDKTVVWVRAHYDPLRVAGYVAAIVLILVVGLNFWSLLVIVGLLVIYELWLHRLRPPETVTLPPA